MADDVVNLRVVAAHLAAHLGKPAAHADVRAATTVREEHGLPAVRLGSDLGRVDVRCRACECARG
jgi:hypothetical protein